MSNPKSSLYSTLWANLWTGGVKSSPHGPEESPSWRLPGFGKEILGMLHFTTVTGDVDLTVSVNVSEDAVTFSEIASVTFKPALGPYWFRIFSDAMPQGKKWIRFDLSTANGTSLIMSSMMLIGNLVSTPSGSPSIPGGGFHFNGFGTGLLENDSNGQVRGFFDFKNSEDL